MANNKHGVVRTDRMIGTTVPTYLVSFKADFDVDNGNVVAIGGYVAGSREVRVATVPNGTSLFGLALVASEESIKDLNRSYDISEFYNKAGTEARGCFFNAHDVFSVTTEALDATSETPAVGQFAVVGASTKIKLVASESDTVVGKVVDIEKDYLGNTFVAIEVLG